MINNERNINNDITRNSCLTKVLTLTFQIQSFATKFWILLTLFREKWKTLREKEKMLVTSIFSFFHNVFYAIKANPKEWVTYIFSSANALSLVKSKTLEFGKALNVKSTVTLTCDVTDIKSARLSVVV